MLLATMSCDAHPVRGCKREYQRRTQCPIRRHLVVTQSCFLHETKALCDSSAAYVPLIAANFYTVGCQRGKSIIRQETHRLCNIPVTSGRSPQPVANLEVAGFPVVGIISKYPVSQLWGSSPLPPT